MKSRACGERPPGHQGAGSGKSVVGLGDASLAWGTSMVRLLQPEWPRSPAWSLDRS